MGFEHNDIVTTDVMNAAIAGGGGGGSFVCTINWDGTEPSHTFQQIVAAYNAGKNVILKAYSMPPQYGQQDEVLYIGRVYIDGGAPVVTFGQPLWGGGDNTLTVFIAKVTGENVWTVERHTISAIN